ncbi:GMC oxidoreductase [Paenibacillus sp. Soil750]|uniref:GMC oxidoreductase n=1 Tax=Paenibacillus sp. Soil750 TaxID=1736398 RepID=UPI0006F42811|nr:GMC family oxidoreductase [Paenibacillus sp. Soil750]KRE64486.1 2-keto-gluconate dehydrogenase [Paenibacillus sp. Soil750]
MRIWVSNNRETLSAIAIKNRLPVEELVLLNPHIVHPDLDITGKSVYLPSETEMSNEIHSRADSKGSIPTCAVAPPEMLNNWIPLTPLSQMAEQEYDVLIIGTGAGGGSVLWRLCEQWKKEKKRIGIIERGDQVIPTHARNLSTLNQERLVAYFSYLSKPLPGSLPEYPGARQLFALGGRTLFWYAFTPRLHEWDLAKWPIPVQEMESYYGIAEQVMNVTGAFAEGASFTEILLERLWLRGYSKASPLPVAADIVPQSFGQTHTDMFTSSISLLARALNQRPFDLAINARATKILHDNGKVTGVTVISPDKTAYTLKAKTVVVSASTFETPRLLLNSGFQNRALGHYLTNQTFVQATGVISTTDFPVPWGPLNIMIPQRPEKPYSVLMTGPEAFYWYPVSVERPLTGETTVNFFGYGKVEPRYENRVTLNPDKIDEYGVPEIKVHFSLSEMDKNVVDQMTEGIKRIAKDTGVRLISKNGNPPICLTPLGDLHHDSGTCRIGDDPNTSVANQYGQIHGISGLYVADNSVLPYIGAENLTLTTVAFAIRAADHIIKQGGKQPKTK